MRVAYLDHNIVSGSAGVPGAANAEEQRNHISTLRAAGLRFAFSAWNIYELARSENDEHIERCRAFIEQLDPLWTSNSQCVKRWEIDRFLQPIFDAIGPVRNRPLRPLNSNVSQMWATFNSPTLPDETLSQSLAQLRHRPAFIHDIRRAARETPAAILFGRKALAAGLLDQFTPFIDREFLRPLLPLGAMENQLEYLLMHRSDWTVACPALAIEDALSALRLREQFIPEENDAVDLQHAVVPLAYCDYLITADRRMRNHCQTIATQLGLPCSVVRAPTEIDVGQDFS